MDRLTLKIFLVLSLFGLSFGQIINETFSDFNNSALNASAVGVYIFDPSISGITITEDQANSHDLSINGWADYAALVAACTGGSPNISGGKSLFNNETAGNYLYTATEDDFRPGTSDFSYVAWFSDIDATSDNDEIMTLGGLSTVIWGTRFIVVNRGINVSLYDATTAYLLTSARQIEDGINGLLTENSWYHIVVTCDRDGNSVGYLNGVANATIDMSSSSGVDVSPVRDLRLLTNYSATSTFGGSLNEFKFFKKVLTPAEIREDFALAKSWVSAKGNVTRARVDSVFSFYQGFYDGDTLSYVVADTNNQSGYHWTATFDAYGGKSGDAVTMYLGSGTPATQALTASSKSYTLNLGTVTTSSDSFFMIASAGDTVYVDNLVVTEATTPTITTHKRNFGGRHDRIDFSKQH